jgi:hypothetical protein
MPVMDFTKAAALLQWFGEILAVLSRVKRCGSWLAYVHTVQHSDKYQSDDAAFCATHRMRKRFVPLQTAKVG